MQAERLLESSSRRVVESSSRRVTILHASRFLPILLHLLLLQVVCTLGPAARDVPILCEMLRAGMNVARFNFSHGSHDYHQETLDNLRQAMQETGIMAAVMLDTKGPEIRTGFLEGGDPVHLEVGQEVTITTDYEKTAERRSRSPASRSPASRSPASRSPASRPDAIITTHIVDTS
jgi:hypothetical protein